jgi:hypothetical protein
LGKASSGLRWREDETREYSWSECSELVREEWLVEDGGSNGARGIGRCVKSKVEQSRPTRVESSFIGFVGKSK